MLADADDRPAIDAIAKSTEVVLSCAGPYRKYSSTMVESCVANGTHYLDTSGVMITLLDDRASKVLQWRCHGLETTLEPTTTRL